MMDLLMARKYLHDRLPADKFWADDILDRSLVRAYHRVWRAKAWRFSVTRGQIVTTADYDTGSVSALTTLTKAVTFTGTALDNTFIGRYLRIGNTGRDYRITAVGSTTTCTLADRYEGDTISTDTGYTISKKEYRLPGDCASVIAFRESEAGGYLPLISRPVFERSKANNQLSGQATYCVESGFSVAPITSAGTVALVKGNTTVTGTSTAFDSRLEGQVIRMDGYPFDFMVSQVNSTTELILARPWDAGDQSALTYKAGPAGVPMVEFYPAHDYNGSVEVWYHRLPPALAYPHDIPGWYPEYDDLWIDAALTQMGFMDEMLLEKRIGDMAERDGIERGHLYQMDAPTGDDMAGGGIRASANSPAERWW